MKDLSLHIPTKAHCAYGAVRKLGAELESYGTRFLLVTEEHLADSPLLEKIKMSCDSYGIELIVYSDVQPFSDSKRINDITEMAVAGQAEGIIGFGDVKTLSIAKASAALGKSRKPAAALIAGRADGSEYPYSYFEIPATVRSPSLFSGALYLTDARNGSAVRLDLPSFRADLGVLDPELLGGYTKKYRLSVVLDTLLSAIEGYFSAESTFFSDTLFLRSIGLSLSNLQKIPEGSEQADTRSRLQQAGFFAAYGLSMSEEGLGTASGYVLSSLKSVPQNVISAVLLPYVLEYGVKTCPEKVSRMGPMLGENLTGLSVVAAADRVVESIRMNLGVEQIPSRLSEVGIKKNEVENAATQIVQWPIVKNLISSPDADEVFSFLRDAL